MYSNTTRITGLSGFDTEGMVKQLMNAESIKYTNLLKKAALTTYKQESYRSVTSALANFQKQFLGVTSNVVNSMRLPSTFKTMAAKATISGNASSDIGVGVSASAKAGNYKMSVYQIARKDQYTSDKVFNPSVSGKMDFSSLIYEIKGSVEAKDEDGKVITEEVEVPLLDEYGEQVLDAHDNPVYETKEVPVMEEKVTGHGLNAFNFYVSLDGAASKNISFSKDELTQYFDIVETTEGEGENEKTVYKSVLKSGKEQDFENALNSKLSAAFGSDSLQNDKQKVSAKIGSDGSIVLNSLPGHTASFSGSTNLLGIASGTKTAYNTNVNLTDLFSDPNDFDSNGDISFKINDVEFTFNKDKKNAAGETVATTLKDVMDKINASSAGVTFNFNQDTGNLVLESKNTGNVSAIRFEGVGASKTEVEAGFARIFSRTSEAQDAVVSMDGGLTKTTRETNSFTIEGINFSLSANSVNDVEQKVSDNNPKIFDINVSSDVSSVKSAILNFVTEYNKLVETINNLYKTSRPRSVTGDYYEPLSDEEKEAMTETQIKDWEEKAKQGLLYRDPILENLISTMRSKVMAPLTLDNGNIISLSSIGISTTGKAGDGGILQVDEEKLNKALEERPDDITELFTKSVNTGLRRGSEARYTSGGIGDRLNDIVELAIGFNGSLDKKAGIEGTTTEKYNDMSKELQAHNEKLSQMLKYLQNREDYYYKMFSKIESAMAKADSELASIQSLLG